MHHQEFEAPQALQSSIKCFWYNTREAAESIPDFEVIPDGYAEIIFHFGTLSDSNGHPLPSPFIMGLLNSPAHFYTKERLAIIGIRCYPWAVFDLLGLKAEKGGIHTFQHAIAGLQPLLAHCIKAGKTEEAIAIITTHFLNTQGLATVDTTLTKAGNAMRHAAGTLPVSHVAAAAHTTVRTLERKFRQAAGHTVKDVSGLMRFEQVRNRLWHQPDVPLAGLAQELGYADQAHMSKEFKRYTGTTPGAFARKAKKGKPFGDSNFVAFVQA